MSFIYICIDNPNKGMETDKLDNAYNEKSWKELLAEILKLTLKLLWRLTFRLFKLIIRGIRWIIKYICKSVKRIVEWWKDNDTQVKVRIIRIKTKALIRLIIRWIIIAAKATGQFLRQALKKAITAIINLKPTVIAIKNALVKGCKVIIKWTKKHYKKAKAKNARRKVKYRNFRKTPGFKGLFTDIGDLLKSLINNYMEEEQTEFTPEAQHEEPNSEKDKKSRTLSNILLNPVKDIVES